MRSDAVKDNGQPEASGGHGQLEQIYDVLVNVCGAPALVSAREQFLREQAQADPPKEWRFGGHLGFGGKFWRNNRRIYVSCYREDENPKRIAIIATANRLLSGCAL